VRANGGDIEFGKWYSEVAEDELTVTYYTKEDELLKDIVEVEYSDE